MTSSLIQTADQKTFIPALDGNMDFSSIALGGVDLEKVWLNHPSLIHLDFLSPEGSPQLSEMLLSPAFQGPGPKAFLLSSPEPLLTLLSINQNSQNSPAGAPPTCFMPTLEENGPPVPNLNSSSLWHDYYSPRGCQGGAQYNNRESDAHGTMIPQGTDHPSGLNKACDGTLEEGLRIHSLWNISQNAALVDQANRLQKRLLAMLGEHASRHYIHQLEGLRRKLLTVSYCPKSPMASGGFFTHTHEMFNAEEDVLGQIPQTHEQSLKSSDLENLAQCGCAVLPGMLESLDSDATLSSSSDDEADHEDAKGSSAASLCHGCEWRWLKERAELCSRWTWLQMRLTELDSQIQQVGELHQQILTNKQGHVVLAETQPLTDRQIQHTLWTETIDLSFTAGNMQDLTSDVDMEPSSPTRLLRNIERQSAQLTQIVNSLMPPFCASPSSSPVTKRPRCHWRDHQKTAFGSQVQADTAVSLSNGPQGFKKTGQKRKRAYHHRQCALQVEVTCVSARTRPLLTYHKPLLFIMDPPSHREQQVLDSFCSLCLKCDPATACTDPTCPHRKEKSTGKVHPVLSLSSDTPSWLHRQNALHAENLQQRPLFLKSDLLRSQNLLSSRCRGPRSLFHCKHQPKNSRHLKKHRRDSTPIRWACARDHHRKAHREEKRKRRCSDWLTDVTHWSDVSPPSDENLEESLENVVDCTPTQQRNSQFSLRSRSSESDFGIDDIPMSLVSSVKVERHQYKHILTPSWRKVDIFSLLNEEEDEQDEGVLESITDEDFRQRHQSYEHKEKLRWSSSNLSRRHRSSRRSCSAVSEQHAYCHSPVDSPVPSTWISSPPEGQTEASVDDTEPVPPWKKRVFSLSDEDKEALGCDEGYDF
ncbi:KAT8 regulatory NSL complex subunit 1-like protein isoform X1 [Triplophysa rosa]|uniref:KAT8 regulatory NSL complex subunit 1-like protein isoform X1 n=1 Tax=Triplophysa rosa TaxID=992332 RepID=UPI0025462ADC|nr:KAT8 regulatory NSL complex subunit 1-like protein isoform X1 [Triplophysa rosa]